MTTIDGIDLITRQGSKFDGDLKLMVRDAYGRERPVTMQLAFYLIDFFTENEREMKRARPFWKWNGDTYFMAACGDAWRDGWRVAADRLRRQREGRGGA